MWQKKKVGHPTRAGEGRLEDPSVETFDAAITHLLGTVELGAEPFQLVARVGDSSRAFQLGPEWSAAQVKTHLWKQYQSLSDLNG